MGLRRLFLLTRALPVYRGAFAVLTDEQGDPTSKRKTRSLAQFVKRVRGK